MDRKHLLLCIFTVLCTFMAARPALPWEVPTPSPECAGDYDANGGYHPKGEQYYSVWGGKRYRCVACSGCVPADTGGGSSGLPVPPVPMGAPANMEQFAQQMALGLISTMIQQALSPPPDNTAYQKQQAELEAAQKEAQQQKLLAMYQTMKQSQASRQKQDMDQLGDILDIGGAGQADDTQAGDIFAVPSLGDQAGELQGRQGGRYDNSGFSMLQRLCCANYFSKSALEAAKKGDYVQARYLNEQADNVMSGLPTEIECRCENTQTATAETGPSIPAQYMEIISRVKEDVKRLDDVNKDLAEIEKKKALLQEKIDKLKTKSPPAKESAQADESKKVEKGDDLTLEAQKLLAQANKELDALNSEEQKLAGQKKEIEERLKEMQQSMQSQGPGPR